MLFALSLAWSKVNQDLSPGGCPKFHCITSAELYGRLGKCLKDSVPAKDAAFGRESRCAQ